MVCSCLQVYGPVEAVLYECGECESVIRIWGRYGGNITYTVTGQVDPF